MHPTTLPVDEVDFLVATIEGELQKISEIAVQIPSLALIPHYANAETTVFMKMLAYHHSYMAEITHDDATRQATENARLGYRDVWGDEGDRGRPNSPDPKSHSHPALRQRRDAGSPLGTGLPHSGSIQRKWDLTGYHHCRRLQMSFYA